MKAVLLRISEVGIRERSRNGCCMTKAQGFRMCSVVKTFAGATAA